MIAPYYEDDHITLYNADWRDHDSIFGDVIITDPPYGETPLAWDRWPTGWPELAHNIAPAMWCFGSLRMFMDQRDDFTTWKFSHDIVWAKERGSSLATDKFARAHELAALWYHGPWKQIRHQVPRVQSEVPHRGTRNHGDLPHMGITMKGTWTDDGTRMHTSIIRKRSELRRAIHPTQKPLAVISPLIEYSCPPGGTVIDLFSGSGSIALAARNIGRKCIAFEINEAYCEASAKRLAQQGFDFLEEETG